MKDDSGRVLKAFSCRLRGFDDVGDVSIEYAESASKARYKFLLHVREPYPSTKFSDVKVRREPGRDMRFPVMPTRADEIDVRDREIVLHAFGGDTHKRADQWGYRNHYCTAPDDPRLNRLVRLGVFRGPCGVDAAGDTPGWAGAFYYLTAAGKELALALIGEREVPDAMLAARKQDSKP